MHHRLVLLSQCYSSCGLENICTTDKSYIIQATITYQHGPPTDGLSRYGDSNKDNKDQTILFKKNPKLLFLLKGYICLFNGLAHVCFLVIFHIYLKINLVLPVTKTLELKIIRMPILFLGASSKPYFK